jgi:hypothetical protein
MTDELESRITVEDLRDKARRIGDMAASEARSVARDRAAQMVIAGVVLVSAAVAVAYYLGSRRCCA